LRFSGLYLQNLNLASFFLKYLLDNVVYLLKQ